MADPSTIALVKTPTVPTAAYVSGLNFQTGISGDGKPRIVVMAHLTEVCVVDDHGVKTWQAGGRTQTIHQDADNPTASIADSMTEIMRLYNLMVSEVAKMNVVLELV